MSPIDPTIFKAYDIRTTYPDKINEENMEDIVRAIYAFFKNKLQKSDYTVALGHDMRLSSPGLYKVALDTLIKSGALVIELGLAPTPTVYFAVQKYGYDAGIQISASHNPPAYNGIKMVLRYEGMLIKIGKITGIDEIKEIALNKQFSEYQPGGNSTLKSEVLQEEISSALKFINPDNLHDLSIVVDPGNAMGILPVEELFKKITAKLIKINFELDGTFPAHQPDPLQYKTLKQLQQSVIDNKASLGIATDGDGDRTMFIDEKGAVIPATYITALIAKEILAVKPGAKIMVDIRYVRNVANIVTKLGGQIIYTKVGHAFITENLNREGAEFAGESSGHFFFKETGGCESSVRVILYVLKAMVESKKPISEMIAELHSSFESGEFNFSLPNSVNKVELISSIVKQYSTGILSKLDGIAIDFSDWRFSIRSSNTENLLRLNVEGDSQAIVSDKVNKLKSMILATGATINE